MTDKLSNHISLRLKELRRTGGFTQLEVARMVGTDANYYAKIERGEATPSLNMFLKITTALKAKSSDILPF